ncbi:DNA-binding transcriptional regulator, MarR family [Lacrimispora sphenoides]|jgi:DNA-binding MarR family transcriptional regulator|uniref:DNA-binding transcriptional regulator, MarR family n=1 Tax=Lacrimispora sphenoides JCM 1415 TaxID=1297793 RepID=A0ABY1C8B9_9FIRM|nr:MULTISPECIES: MarR family transcriptional regulator [Lacrimispora]EXG87241.1 transcriptional regulator [Clostridium sp. ASBs410]SET79861.1 DNA-binding transcriptional regulator, MarR family [[Clostridium] sphenoides JCM 1415]SEU33012.1 DNA-binding transcriptional regulator, MarR family [Lacrimispora sphenoides]SUY51356.1 MarR family transcriptional regulator [Lacrimispora sphenoides]
MFNLDDCIAFVTCKGAKDLADTLEKRLNNFNITRSQWIALYYIENNNMITQKQLADKMSLKEPSVVRLLDKMELYGWVNRISSNDDKRMKFLMLTDSGKEIETAMLDVAEKFKSDVLNGISHEDLDVFKSTLNKMLINIEDGSK